MDFVQDFQLLDKDEVLPLATKLKEQGWRFVNVLATTTPDGIDLTYSYMKDAHLANYTVVGLQKTDEIESVSPLFFNAFVFENEAHDLFGVSIKNIVLDFEGTFYDLAISEPMTILSPAQKAARDAKLGSKDSKEDKLANLDPEKAAKVKAALAAKAQREKIANLDPEKAAKVKAALAAKAKREKAASKGGETNE